MPPKSVGHCKHYWSIGWFSQFHNSSIFQYTLTYTTLVIVLKTITLSQYSFIIYNYCILGFHHVYLRLAMTPLVTQLKYCSMGAELLIQQPGLISMYRIQVDHKFIKGPKFDLVRKVLDLSFCNQFVPKCWFGCSNGNPWFIRPQWNMLLGSAASTQ